ncbi:MAG: hypothetical protein ISS79_00695 [Phycisphaerae bacterium]|nr:hypothetical protein [Phycisphaerae bacterium]
MRIPKYWTKATHTANDQDGRELTFSAYGWSFDSINAARENALSRAQRVFDRLVNGSRPDEYDYLDRPLREEITDTLRHGDSVIAHVTRNRYGALVLNAASVLFVDIDFPRIKPNGLWDTILLIFSSKRKQQRIAAAQESALESVRDWARRNPGYAFRVYRTYAGLRLLFIDKLYEPNSNDTSRILSELGSDPLYRKLTSKQECFRARLTPKPWRCGSTRPPAQFPWTDETEEQAYRQWQQHYTHCTGKYKVCYLIETHGSIIPNAEIDSILKLHDNLACNDDIAQLA